MGLRTGAEYLASLDDGREVWYDGSRITNVATHAAFQGSIKHVAGLYDDQHLSEYRSSLVHWNSDLSEYVGNTFLKPRSRQDIQARRKTIEHWALKSNGMMGRTGDYVGSMMTAWAMNSQFFEERFARNVTSFYDMCAKHDLFLVHALVDPQIDRSVNRGGQAAKDVLLRCTSSSDEGIRVSGIKTIATSAAIADEVIVWPLPVPQSEAERDYALAFSAAINSPGLKVVCRNSFCPPYKAVADYPLASRFDEIDAVLIFDDVLVPWEKVFAFQDVERLKAISRTRARELTAHQTNIRLLIKIEFICGVLNLMAESIGIHKAPAIQETLGECAAHVEQLRALIDSAESNGQPDGEYFYPSLTPLQVGRLLGPQIYPKLSQLINRLGGGGLMQAPSSITQLDGELGAYIEQYCGGAGNNARERIKLLRLAWDLVATEFGSRHLLYEIFYSGDPSRLTAAFQAEYAKEPHMARVRNYLSSIH